MLISYLGYPETQNHRALDDARWALKLFDTIRGHHATQSLDETIHGVTSYRSYLLQLSVIDTRTWGDPPSIYIIDDSCLIIVYYQQDGTKVYYSLKPVEGYFNRFVIFENGTYKTQLIGDYND